MEITVRFSMPTDWVGVEFEDERCFTFDEDADKDDINYEIEMEFNEWVDDILNDMRSWAEFEIVEEV